MNRVQNNKAWWLAFPVFLQVACSAVIAMTSAFCFWVTDIYHSSS